MCIGLLNSKISKTVLVETVVRIKKFMWPTSDNLSSDISYLPYRSDIDGLRAVAVFAVVGFHAFPNWIKGGFIGVDVFFVISGFLISNIIFRKLDKSIFSFPEFYSRRIKRIFPAFLMVLLFTYLFGWVALFPDEYKQLGKHIAGGVAFVSNYVIWSESGYFDKAAETKPLLHLWSLGIEEQFYIIWPLVVWVGWKLKLNLRTLIIMAVIGSFWINILGTQTDGIATFYSPLTRFWELLSGSFLAWLIIYNNKKYNYIIIKIDSIISKLRITKSIENDGKIISNIMSFAGIALICFSVFQINKEMNYLGSIAILPVIGSIFIIIAGQDAWINRTILSNIFMIWSGLISFPLYLWHWPIFSYLKIINGEQAIPTKYLYVAIFLSILLASLTYFFLERPIRNNANQRLIIPALLALSASIGAIGIAANYGITHPHISEIFPEDTQIALHMPTPEFEKNKCLGILGLNDKKNIRYCSISSEQRQPTVALIGDSHSAASAYGIFYFFEKEHGKTVANLAGRLFSNVVNYPSNNSFEETVYKGGFEVAEYIISNKKFDTIIMISRGFFNSNWPDNFYIESKPYLTTKEAVFLEGLNDILAKLRDRKILFVYENPTLNFNPNDCKASRPITLFDNDDCSISRDYDDKIHKEYIDKVSKLLMSYSNVTTINPRDILCDTNKCFAKKEGKVLYSDIDHLNRNGSWIQGAQISDAFKRIK